MRNDNTPPPLFYREWLIIFVLISSILAVMVIGTIKRKVVQNRLQMAIQQDLEKK